MLRSLRNQTQSIFFKCFLVLLICGFALWGVGDLTGGSRGNSVLSVENQNISTEEALNEINRARYMLPDRPSLEEAIKNGIHKSVLNKLEQEMLINEEANFLDLNVPLTEQMRVIKEENLTQVQLAKKLGVDKAIVNKIVHHKISHFTSDRLMDLFSSIRPLEIFLNAS